MLYRFLIYFATAPIRGFNNDDTLLSIEDMKQAQGITEQLKAENQLEWVQRVNHIQACAREIVNEGIIYA